MAESTFQSEIPKARVNIQLDLHTGSAQKKVELPLKILALGDFSNGKENRPVSERSPININKNNFDSVLSELNCLRHATAETRVIHLPDPDV